jgi:hypothetical protein
MTNDIKTQEQKDILNKEARVRASKKYYLKNKTRMDERNNEYNKNHLEERNASQKKYYNALKENEEGYNKLSIYHKERYIKLKELKPVATRARGRPKKIQNESSGEESQ